VFAIGCAKLGVSRNDVRVVLEADGTEVDEEDYFSFLNSDATLMLLSPSQQWRPAGLGEFSAKGRAISNPILLIDQQYCCEYCNRT
jgi:hypothetical protein